MNNLIRVGSTMNRGGAAQTVERVNAEGPCELVILR
jgi:hypothetical protein